jgi:hypothetical protein
MTERKEVKNDKAVQETFLAAVQHARAIAARAKGTNEEIMRLHVPRISADLHTMIKRGLYIEAITILRPLIEEGLLTKEEYQGLLTKPALELLTAKLQDVGAASIEGDPTLVAQTIIDLFGRYPELKELVFKACIDKTTEKIARLEAALTTEKISLAGLKGALLESQKRIHQN